MSEFVSRVPRGRGISFCVVLSAMLTAQGSAFAGKLGPAFGPAAGTAGGAVGGGVSAEATRQALAAKGMSEDDFFRELFSRGIPRATQGLPKMVDADTQLYDVTGKGREWGYWYRIARYSSRELDPAVVKKAIAPSLISQVCSTPAMVRPFMDLGGSYRYNYVGKDGKLVTSILVSRQDCN